MFHSNEVDLKCDYWPCVCSWFDGVRNPLVLDSNKILKILLTIIATKICKKIRLIK